MIEEVDEWIGQMLARLRDSGLDKNTLIVFTSDHGELLGAHGGMKGDIMGGICVVMIVPILISVYRFHGLTLLSVLP